MSRRGCMKSRLKIVRTAAPVYLAVCTLCFAGIGLFAQGTAATVDGTVSGGAVAVPQASLGLKDLNTAVNRHRIHQFSKMRHWRVPGRNV